MCTWSHNITLVITQAGRRLLTSGLRIEEARELTTLDILKRGLPTGEAFTTFFTSSPARPDARVIPIGDQLGTCSLRSSNT